MLAWRRVGDLPKRSPLPALKRALLPEEAGSPGGPLPLWASSRDRCFVLSLGLLKYFLLQGRLGQCRIDDYLERSGQHRSRNRPWTDPHAGTSSYPSLALKKSTHHPWPSSNLLDCPFALHQGVYFFEGALCGFV